MDRKTFIFALSVIIVSVSIIIYGFSKLTDSFSSLLQSANSDRTLSEIPASLPQYDNDYASRLSSISKQKNLVSQDELMNDIPVGKRESDITSNKHFPKGTVFESHNARVEILLAIIIIILIVGITLHVISEHDKRVDLAYIYNKLYKFHQLLLDMPNNSDLIYILNNCVDCEDFGSKDCEFYNRPDEDNEDDEIRKYFCKKYFCEHKRVDAKDIEDDPDELVSQN